MKIIYMVFILISGTPHEGVRYTINDETASYEFCQSEKSRLEGLATVLWRQEQDSRLMAKSWIEYEVSCAGLKPTKK